MTYVKGTVILCVICTLRCWWSCMCLSSGTADRFFPHRIPECSCKWRTLGKSCQSPLLHSGCSQHWNTYKRYCLEPEWWLSTTQCTRGYHPSHHQAMEHREMEAKITDLFFCSSSKLAAFHSEPWKQLKVREVKPMLHKTTSCPPYRCNSSSSTKGNLQSHDNILAKAHFC